MPVSTASVADALSTGPLIGLKNNNALRLEIDFLWRTIRKKTVKFFACHGIDFFIRGVKYSTPRFLQVRALRVFRNYVTKFVAQSKKG